MTSIARETTAKRGYKVKEVAVVSPIKEFPTINLKENDDVNFPSVMNGMKDEAQPMYHESNNKVDNDGSEGVHTSGSARTIYKPMEGGSTDVYLIGGGHENEMTGLNGSTSMSDFMSMDTIVPEAVIPKRVDNFAREMWLVVSFSTVKRLKEAYLSTQFTTTSP